VNVLYVVHQYFPECFSGTEQYCLAVSREARRRGLSTTILSLEPDAGRDDPPLLVHDRPYDGCSVLRLRHWWGLEPNDALRDYHNPLVAEEFRRVLQRVGPAVVHFFHLRNLGSDLLQVAKDCGARTVVHLMDFWYLCPRFTLLRRDGTLCEGPPDGGLGCVTCHLPELDGVYQDPDLGPIARDFAQQARRAEPGWSRASRFAALVQRRAVQFERLHGADAVIAPSRFLLSMFQRNGFQSDRTHVVGYGLEPGRVERRAVTRPRTPLRLTFSGVLSPWKGPQVAIEAVRRTQAPIQLRVFGRLEEPMFAEHIASLRRAAGDDPRIEFCGAYGADRLSDVLADTDVLLVPSTWYENTPFVMLEALAAGVPVAASALGGMAELVAEGRSGFLFPPGDAGALARLIERWCADPSMLARLDPQPTGSIADAFDRFLAIYRA
jgi:glycosyltransferase involved in cell wall biosynthesis